MSSTIAISALVAVAVSFVCRVLHWDLVPFLGLFVYVLVLGAYASILLCAVVSAFRRRSAGAAFRVNAVLLLFAFEWKLGWMPARRMRFAFDQSSYERRVLIIQRKEADAFLADSAHVDGRPVFFDETCPERLAFPLGGLLDNWYGYAYDPTGELGKPNVERDLFGGKLIHVFHLNGGWYFVAFT